MYNFFYKLSSTNWILQTGPVCRIPVFRILELEKNNMTNDVGLIQSIKRAPNMSPFPGWLYMSRIFLVERTEVEPSD